MSEIPTYTDLFSQSFRARLRVAFHAFRAKALFGFQAIPVVQDVCTDKTGHAEVVEVEFDPSQVSYDELLNVFWANHNPTTPNRQGPDVGTQYRSVIFYYSPEQKSAAETSRKNIDSSGRFQRPVVTQIEPAPTFWRAEEYHQRYLQKRGKAHCAI